MNILIEHFTVMYIYIYPNCECSLCLTILTGVTYDTEEVYAIGSNQGEIIPQVGSWIAVEVTTIISPYKFYVILPLGNKSLEDMSGWSAKSQSKSKLRKGPFEDNHYYKKT